MLSVKKYFYFEFAEENPHGEGNKDQTPDGAKNTENKDGQTNPTGQQEHMIPKSRFDEINTKYKELQGKIDEFINEKSKAEKKAKEEQGKFEELYKTTNDELTKFKDDHKVSSQRVKQLENVINGLLETRLSNVPEEFRDLVPTNLNPEAKLEWLTAAEAKGLFKAVSQKKTEPVGENTNPAGSQTSDLNQLSPMQMLRAAYGHK